jgi:hypothetical protein
MQRELVGVAEVATRLGLTAERVRQLSKGGGMPEPVGELGRRLIWDWRDVEAWARKDGRLGPSKGESRQVARPWRDSHRGALRLVVDEVMQWGEGDGDVSHVRVWAPALGTDETQIVLLGQLQDQVSSVTNNVEAVAMAAAVRYLGPAWRIAQFYQYSPPTLLEDDDSFLHVTFTIKSSAQPARWQSLRRGRSTVVRTLGAELTDPDWRQTSLDELEHLTGDSPRIWTPGTYTRALVEHSRSPDANLEVTWDPERAYELSVLAAELAEDSRERTVGLDVRLSDSERMSVQNLMAGVALSAYETARQDVATQRADAVLTVRSPRLRSEAQLFVTAGRHPLDSLDPHVLWAALTTMRQALIEGRFQDDPGLDRQRRLLAPGLRGGWVPLHWADAGVDDETPPREGWCSPIALPEDLIVDENPPSRPALTLLLLDTIANHLQESWADWHWHDVPVFMPSTVVAATGPLSRAYLDQLKWQPIDSADPARLQRLANREDLDEVAVDDDGWLVAIPKNRAWFVCEWPVSGPPDASLKESVIRADRSEPQGSTPVYLEDALRRLRLLPSAGHRHHGNSYAWGYGGGGPWDLGAAAVDLLGRASGSPMNFAADTAHEVVNNLVASPRTPNWRVSDLLEQISRHRPRRPRTKSAPPT